MVEEQRNTLKSILWNISATQDEVEKKMLADAFKII